MAIYAEKDKSGQLTGGFRVEVTRAGVRTRERHTDMKSAKAAEARLKAGGDKLVKPSSLTLMAALELSRSALWIGQSSATTSWPRLDRMVGLLGRETRLDRIDTAMVDRMAVTLLKAGISEATLNRYLSHLHVFLTWCCQRGHRSVPVTSITFDWRDEDEGRIRWLTPPEEARLLEMLPPAVWRVVKIAIETGCRRGELLKARLDQIAGDRLFLEAPQTKTGKARTIHMEPWVTQLLRDAIAEGMPSESDLAYQWDKARAVMGLSGDEGFTFHVTRHTCATRLVDAGVGIAVIKEFLGHADIRTTMRYAHIRSEALEDAVAKRKAFREAA